MGFGKGSEGGWVGGMGRGVVRDEEVYLSLS